MPKLESGVFSTLRPNACTRSNGSEVESQQREQDAESMMSVTFRLSSTSLLGIRDIAHNSIQLRLEVDTK